MKSIIKKSQTRSLAADEAAPRSAASPREACGENVRLLSENGLVHAVEITCKCGSVTVVELEYPAGTEAPR